MFLSVKEMELLCIFYEGPLAATLALLQRAQDSGDCPPGRADDLAALINKLSQMKAGDVACLQL